VCSPAAIAPAVGAVSSAMGASAANKAARRNYEHQLKVRERKWMQRRTTYASKKVQFEQEVDLANIAAQRAYSQTQYELRNAKILAILQNQEDFKKVLANEGSLQASAAERGIRGKSLARLLALNLGTLGMSQSRRTRGLTEASYRAKGSNEEVNRQLKSQLNQSFGKVVLNPIPDIAPPPPVTQNVGMTLMLGMGQALGAGLEGAATRDWRSKQNQNQQGNDGDNKENNK
tara:strand:- start:976 stop:1668 length:693 start_codon:yes stop_codon:yes gene_type:complete